MKGGTMKIKRKLSFGLGFLFFIIFGIVIFSSYYIQKLSRESDNILKNNYDSIVYSKKMLVALDDMMSSINIEMYNPNKNRRELHYRNRLFESGKVEFEKNLKSEINNITEIHEKEYVETLKSFYETYITMCRQIKSGQGGKTVYISDLLPSYEKLRYTLSSINDLNMQAIVRKNKITKKDSRSIIMSMALVGSVCIVLAFAYFWYFPFYISNSIMFLSNKTKELLLKAGITPDVDSEDEFHDMLQSLNLLEDRVVLKGKGKRLPRV
jgi:two-component system, NtrC family, sensor histidine kinase KinB